MPDTLVDEPEDDMYGIMHRIPVGVTPEELQARLKAVDELMEAIGKLSEEDRQELLFNA